MEKQLENKSKTKKIFIYIDKQKHGKSIKLFQANSNIYFAISNTKPIEK